MCPSYETGEVAHAEPAARRGAGAQVSTHCAVVDHYHQRGGPRGGLQVSVCFVCMVGLHCDV